MKEAALRYSQSKINSLQWPIKLFYILFSTPCSGIAKTMVCIIQSMKQYMFIKDILLFQKRNMFFFSNYVTDCRLHVTMVKMFVLESTAIVRVQAFYCNHTSGINPYQPISEAFYILL